MYMHITGYYWKCLKKSFFILKISVDTLEETDFILADLLAISVIGRPLQKWQKWQ